MKIAKYVLVALTVFSLFGCKKKEIEKKEPIKIKTQTIKKRGFEKKFELIGEVQAVNSADVFVKMPLKVVSYRMEDNSLASENAFLKKGDVFAYLDNEEIKIAFDQAIIN